MQTDIDKPEVAPVPIWRCKDPACKAWIREEMAEGPEPVCPLCKSNMIRGIRHLPKLVNKHKNPRKKAKDTFS